MTDRSTPSRGRIWLRRGLWAVLGLCVFVVLVILAARITVKTVSDREAQSWWSSGLSGGQRDAFVSLARVRGDVSGPEIQFAARLSLQTQDFDRCRAEIEEMVRQMNGQFQEFQILMRSGSSRILEASLRVPAVNAEEAIRLLRGLGRVQEESQSGEAVDAEKANLEAQVARARSSLDRMNQISRRHPGSVGDLLAVEKEIASAKGEIDDLEMRLRKLTRRTRLAVIQVRLVEELVPQLSFDWAAARRELRDSAVQGTGTAANSLLGLTSLLLGYGPTALIWSALLWFPVRYAWRRWRPHRAEGH